MQPPHTMIAGAKKLRPGHYVVWKDGVLSEQRPFWSIPAPRRAATSARRDEELAGELWTTLDGAVERQLVADVPVGIFLSGGLDSSAVATLARARARDRR